MNNQPILKLINVQKKYDDGFLAIQNFNLDILKGEFVTLLGPSGCGKTTLLKIIGGFEQLTSGKVLYNSIDIKDLKITQRPTSTVFQDYALFPNMTVEQNIKYGLKLMRTQLDNIPPDLYIKANSVYNESLKKSASKIKEIKKKSKNLKQTIEKLEKKYERNEFLFSIKDMRKPQYQAVLNSLYEQLENEIQNGYVKQSSFSDTWRIFLNKINSFFNIKKTYDINLKNKHPIEIDILRLKKWYGIKRKIDIKYDMLTDKYNNLDYNLSYWQTYPQLKKEEFEKRNITRKINREEIDEKFKKVVNLVGLNGKEKSFPNELSGGMQQRVALARSIVIEPEIILLDEPLSALDAKVKKQLQEELKRLHKELKITFILVTHDQEEALMLSDKIVVMSDGKIEQVGTPEQIYDTPKNLWVANFIGKANIYQSETLNVNNELKFIFCDYCFDLDLKKDFEINDIYFLIRPEDFIIVKNNEGIINNVFVKSVNYTGLFYDLVCEYKDKIINIKSIYNIDPNQNIGLNILKENIHIIYGDN